MESIVRLYEEASSNQSISSTSPFLPW